MSQNGNVEGSGPLRVSLSVWLIYQLGFISTGFRTHSRWVLDKLDREKGWLFWRIMATITAFIVMLCCISVVSEDMALFFHSCKWAARAQGWALLIVLRIAHLAIFQHEIQRRSVLVAKGLPSPRRDDWKRSALAFGIVLVIASWLFLKATKSGTFCP